MGEDPLDAHRRATCICLVEIVPRQDVRHRVVQPQLPGIALLHHPDRGEELRDRADGVHGGGRGLDTFVGVRVPVAFRPDEILIVHQPDRHRRDLLVVHLGVEPDLEEIDRLLEAGVIRGIAGRLGAAGRRSEEESDEGGESEGSEPGASWALHATSMARGG